MHIKKQGRSTSSGEGRGYYEEVKEDDYIYLKCGHLKKFGMCFGQANRHTNRQKLWFIGKLHFQKYIVYC